MTCYLNTTAMLCTANDSSVTVKFTVAALYYAMHLPRFTYNLTKHPCNTD